MSKTIPSQQGADLSMTPYQADRFYDEVVSTVEAMEYPSMDMFRHILGGHTRAFLRGKGIRVTVENVAYVIQEVVKKKGKSRGDTAEWIKKFFQQVLTPQTERQVVGGRELMRGVSISGGSITPVYEIEGVGRLVVTNNPQQSLILNIDHSTVVFTDLDHFRKYINNLQDTVLGIEHFFMDNRDHVIPAAYAYRLINDVEDMLREELAPWITKDD